MTCTNPSSSPQQPILLLSPLPRDKQHDDSFSSSSSSSSLSSSSSFDSIKNQNDDPTMPNSNSNSRMNYQSLLTSEDIETMRLIRSDIWTNAFYGLGIGSMSGYVLHTLYYQYQSTAQKEKLAKLPPYHKRNALFASLMLGGAFGSFLLGTSAGKNRVHELHPIFDYAKTKQQQQVQQQVQQQQFSFQQYQHPTANQAGQGPLRNFNINNNNQQQQQSNNDNDDYDTQLLNKDIEFDRERLERKRNRVLRRKTLKKNLTVRHGLNDSHGGHWISSSSSSSSSSEGKENQSTEKFWKA